MPAPKGYPPYPGCEKGGRPRRFSTEDIERFADELVEWMKDESRFWLKDFCLERGLTLISGNGLEIMKSLTALIS